MTRAEKSFHLREKLEISSSNQAVVDRDLGRKKNRKEMCLGEYRETGERQADEEEKTCRVQTESLRQSAVACTEIGRQRKSQ
ncbi:hypothetical protein RUM43_011343 [Polyplax serrata]|uniref:Uncharacterized protein n=1 Tax=Polyplax serrata TaxID=468196 RepID=A0AAN8NM05_POLSC